MASRAGRAQGTHGEMMQGDAQAGRSEPKGAGA